GSSVRPPGSVASWPGICGTPPGTGTTLCALAFGSFGRPGLTGWLAFLAGASGAAESRPARYGFTGPWWWDEETTLALPRQPAAASPRIATALPQTFTGAVIGATIWLPPRIDPRPEVRLPPAPLPEPPTTLAPPMQAASERPSTATALPQTFTGAVIGATIWLPPRIEPAPEVRLPPAPLPARPTTLAPPLHPANALPSTATALPQTFTGAVTGATTWLPPRIEPAPEVRLPPAPLPARPTTLAPPLHPALAPPATATAVPHTFTGAVTGATTWLPPRIESAPEVRLPPAPGPPCP